MTGGDILLFPSVPFSFKPHTSNGNSKPQISEHSNRRLQKCRVANPGTWSRHLWYDVRMELWNRHACSLHFEKATPEVSRRSPGIANSELLRSTIECSLICGSLFPFWLRSTAAPSFSSLAVSLPFEFLLCVLCVSVVSCCCFWFFTARERRNWRRCRIMTKIG